MNKTAFSKKKLRILVTDSIDLRKITLIMRSLIYKTTTAEDLDIIHKSLQKSIVGPALYICIVTQTAI